MILMLVGVLGWVASVAAGLWYLSTVKEMRDELRTIRRYLQAIHEKQNTR